MIRPIKKLTTALQDGEKKVTKTLSGHKKTAFEKFPLLFTFLGVFGVVATFYGFERLIDSISFFDQYPFAILLVGIATLVFTGSLYDRLS